MVRFIGLMGSKGSGKDTLARYLVSMLGFVRVSFADALYQEVAESFGVSLEYLSNRRTKERPRRKLTLARCANTEFVEIALQVVALGRLSLAFKQRLPALWHWWQMHAWRSPRWILQIWGTEYRRQSRYGYDAYWVDRVRRLIESNRSSRFVITDVRFKNEVQFVRQYGGMLVRIRRPKLEEQEARKRAQGSATALHASETELAHQPVDLEVINREGEPESLLEGLDVFLPELRKAA